MNLRFVLLWGSAFVLFLTGCESQRTVTHTESKMGFGDGWAEQVGDEKKMKEKFASGFEIRDGRAVATGEKQNPFTHKEYATGDSDLKKESGLKKDYATKEFGTDKKAFATKPYEKGTPARETGSRAPWNRKSANGIMDDEFATSEWAQAARGFDSGDRASEQGRKFAFSGREGRAAPISTQADRVGVNGGTSAPIMPGSPVTTLSVDDVRKMLSPEAFR